MPETRLRRGLVDRADRAHRPGQPARRTSRFLRVAAARRAAGCSTTASPGRTAPEPARAGGFIDRYVFPDGELEGPGTIISAMQDNGFEVRHEENLREHYAMTLRDWGANLDANWDEAVAEVGLAKARVWRLYLAASRVGLRARTRSSCTRCSASSSAPTTTAGCRCARTGDRPASRPAT